MENCNFKFNDIAERDMDLLFLEEIVSSNDFAKIFLDKIGVEEATVLEAELSKTAVDLGESDITVILSTENKKHALLIEDKIDAKAMPQQCERYFKRGEHGISNGEYDSFSVFIVAPEKYLSQNAEASKYPNKVTYEECATYFYSLKDMRSSFKYEQISQAIHKQKSGYQVIEDRAVTDFWDKYITYQEENYPELWITNKRGSKGFWSRWAFFNTVLKKLLVYHKSEYGYVDLTIDGTADKIVLLEELLIEESFDLERKDMFLVKAGKSAVVRMYVPKLDFTQPFEIYLEELPVCFEAVARLADLAKEISKSERLLKLING